VDLESVADELYGASPDEFVERRKERAAAARSAGDRALVKAIGQLRRPTRSAWMVNLLARESPNDIERLLELGVALVDAQQRASGADLRRLSTERRAAIEALTRRATDLATANGYAATEAVRQEVSQTMQAALAESSVAGLVRAGRLTQPVSYGGFGPMELFGLAPSREQETLTASPEEPTSAVESDREQGPDDPARREAEAAVRAAAGELDAAREQATEAERDAERATMSADELVDRVEALRGQLAEAEAEERDARGAARAARKHAQQRQQAVSDAEQSLAEARRLLDGLDQS
jgi:hypothetical protein